METYKELKSILEKYNQEHLLQFFDEFDERGKSKLIEAIKNIDFDTINELIKLIRSETKIEKNIKQAKYIPIKEEDEDASLFYGKDNFHHKMHLKGEELIKQGKVASFVVAGGQGTRLGYDSPKGVYPIGPVSGKSLFQFHFEALDTLQKKYKVQIPFLIMTSEMTHNDTIKFLDENNFFGYNKDNVFIFQQGKMPAIDFNGKILLSEKDSPAFSPNGHGGSIFALKDSGVLDKLIKKGIEHIFYFQIDNVMVKMCEPYFFGCHINNHSNISIKVIEKAYPEEKLGVYVINNNKPCIIEYSDLSKEELYEKDDDGKLKYRLGSHAIHILSVSFLKEFTDKHKNLPFHKAIKKVPYIDNKGNLIQPDEPNGVKFEMFIFDILSYSTIDKVCVVEGIREREFAPLKNKEGNDSIFTAHNLYMKDCARILRELGLKDIPIDKDGNLVYKIEISPYLKVFTDELKKKITDIKKVDKDIYIH